MSADTTAPRIIVALWCMVGASFALLSLRFYYKLRFGKRSGWDDIIVAFSWVCLLAYSALTTASCNFGIGQHLSQIDPAILPMGLKLLYVGRFFGIIAVSTSKTSFAFTLLRLIVKPWQRFLIIFIVVSLNIIMWLCAAFLFLQCSPVEKAWLLETPGTCWNNRITIGYSIFAGVYSALMDFILALLPWFLVWRLQMKRREKLGVALAMSLGVLAGITAAIKTSYLTGTSRNADFTYTSADLLIWSASETAVTIIAASIPFLRPMIKQGSQQSRQPYRSSYRLEDTNGSKPGEQPTTITTIKHERVYVERGQNKQDDGSDKSILGAGADNNMNILVINQVRVDHVQEDVKRQQQPGGE